jgi:hypothetical protein
MNWSVMYGFIPFYVSAILALAMALGYKAIHKRWGRRSPLAGRPIGKSPGQELVGRISGNKSGVITTFCAKFRYGYGQS